MYSARIHAHLQQQLALGELVDGIDRQHSTAAHVGVPVLQVAEDGWNQGLQDLFFPYAAQKAQGHAPDVLIRVLQIVPQILADQDLRVKKVRERVKLVDNHKQAQQALAAELGTTHRSLRAQQTLPIRRVRARVAHHFRQQLAS